MTQAERILAGRYRIGRRIGRGGMAEVYAAVDERLGRHVAVKLLHTNLAGEPAFRSRFRQEAQAAARMTHPTIVRVYDAGEDTFVRSDGFEVIVPYIVMEYIDGRPLGDIMAEGPLPEAKVSKYMAGLLTSLEYSHRAGVVHRDIKPSNVMITTADEVKVTDFGIARAISDTASTIAQTTAILGTASYFSPEQARGETVDGRSDLYSAGVVLYEMLTGRVPFIGDSAVAVAYQHVTEPPRRPSEVNPNVSPALDAVVLKALAKRVDDRYQTAAEFRDDLQAAFRGVMPAYTRRREPREQPNDLFGPAPTAIDATQSALDAMDQSDDRAPQVQRRPPSMWIWGAVALVAAVVIAVVFWVVALKPLDLPAASITVPDLVGKTQQEALALVEQAGLQAESTGAPDKDAPEGQVTAQVPPAGASVSASEVVHITVSTGPEAVRVPDVTGMTQNEARKAFEDVGLKLGSVSQENSPSVAEGRVIRTEPSMNLLAAPKSTVNLFVSSGKVTLPDVRGEKLEDAKATLTSLGLKPVDQKLASCTAAEGNPVVNMGTPPGPVEQRSEVALSYCTGAPRDTLGPSSSDGAGQGGGDGTGDSGDGGADQDAGTGEDATGGASGPGRAPQLVPGAGNNGTGPGSGENNGRGPR